MNDVGLHLVVHKLKLHLSDSWRQKEIMLKLPCTISTGPGRGPLGAKATVMQRFAAARQRWGRGGVKAKLGGLATVRYWDMYVRVVNLPFAVAGQM